MDEKVKFKLMAKCLRDLADRIEKQEVKPTNITFNRAYERILNNSGEVIDFKPGTTSLTVEWKTDTL